MVSRHVLLSCSRGLRLAACEQLGSPPWTWLALQVAGKPSPPSTARYLSFAAGGLPQSYGSRDPTGSFLSGVVSGQQRRSLFIQTQPTPNPASMMFLPGSTVMESGTANFENTRDAMKSPLAKKLMVIDGITGVFFGNNFVTVTKSDDFTWPMLKPDIFATVMDHFTSGVPLFEDAALGMAAPDTMIHEDDSDVVAMIKELLDTRIRPAVQEDGGDITYKDFIEDSGTVILQMQGACSGCPSSAVTLKGGIENMLMHYIPEVKMVVEAPPDDAQNMGLSEFDKLEKHLSA